MTSHPLATTSSEQDHDNAIFGSEHISFNTTKSLAVQEEPVAVSAKVYAYTYLKITVSYQTFSNHSSGIGRANPIC